MKTIDLSNNEVEDCIQVAHLPALEGLIPSTSMQGAAVWESQFDDAHLLTLVPYSMSGQTTFSLPPVSSINGSLEWLMKLTRINHLLAEAAQLQSEVFK